jgi:hypothetical protein
MERDARQAAAWSANENMDVLGIARSVAWGAVYAKPRSKNAERTAQAQLLRDIFNDPFHSSTDALAPPTFDSTLTELAQAAYEKRKLPSGYLDNSMLLTLAGALEERGFNDDRILTHCRDAGPHVRGCWVIDLIMSKQ